MGVLHVVHRVVIVFGHCQIHVKGVLGVGLAAQQKKAHRVPAGPLDQVAQRDIAARALGDLDLFAPLDHPHHGVQHIVGVARRHASTGSLQAGAHPGDGAVVVGALDIDGFFEAALPFADVVGHVGHKVGVTAVSLAHDPVFVVAVVGRPEPQRAILFIGFASGLQPAHGVIDPAAAVEAAFKVIVVKLDSEGLQVKVLLVAQIGHGKLAQIIECCHIPRGRETAVVSGHGFLG